MYTFLQAHIEGSSLTGIAPTVREITKGFKSTQYSGLTKT
jgi:hypothetical protein